MARLPARYIAECDRNRSRTWSVIDRWTGKTAQARLLNRDEARWAATRMNMGLQDPDDGYTRMMRDFDRSARKED